VRPQTRESIVAVNAKWLRRIESLDKTSVLFAGLALVVTIGSIDALTERAFHYCFMSTIFYLVPISLVSWTCEKKYAHAVTLSAAATDTFATLYLSDQTRPLPFLGVDMFLQFLLFATFSVVLLILRTAFDHERKASRTDMLTGIYNSRGFQEVATLELARMRRYGSSICVIYLDIDDFKIINDTMGHKEGDNILATFGEVLQRTTREVDTVGRLGGDEFAVILPEAILEQGTRFVTRLKGELAKALHRSVTFSAGVVCFATAPSTVDTLLEPADAMMYAAKRNGHNGVMFEEAFSA
jgi:diguanylate cyclase (GGDEF)-like protein